MQNKYIRNTSSPPSPPSPPPAPSPPPVPSPPPARIDGRTDERTENI